MTLASCTLKLPVYHYGIEWMEDFRVEFSGRMEADDPSVGLRGCFEPHGIELIEAENSDFEPYAEWVSEETVWQALSVQADAQASLDESGEEGAIAEAEAWYESRYDRY